MIEFNVFKKGGDIVKFSASGHSGYSESGSDIVCAAVSGVCQSTIIGLSEVLKIDADFVLEDGFISLTMPCDTDEKKSQAAQALLKSLEIFVKELSSKYNKYLCLHELEV